MLKIPNNIFVVLRVLAGGVFVVSGAEKLLSHYQNFLYVVQGYALFPSVIEELIARTFPWIEFLIGVFIVLGFNLFWALRAMLVCLAVFITIIGQAILRKLPIEECGCFGSLISFPLEGTLLFDSCLLIVTVILVFNLSKASTMGLDRLFEKK